MPDSVLLSVDGCKALAAIYGAVVLGYETNLCFLAALCANCGEQLSGSLTCALLRISASLASLRLVLEILLCVELLLSCSEDELLSALLAY